MSKRKKIAKTVVAGAGALVFTHFASHAYVNIEKETKEQVKALYVNTIAAKARALGFNVTPKLTPLSINEVIMRETVVNGVSPAYAVIFKALVLGESNGDSRATSEADAKGLSQVHHSNAGYCGHASADELYEDEANIVCGFRLFAEALKNQKYNLINALKEYHGGADKRRWGKKTEAYPGYILSKLKDLE